MISRRLSDFFVAQIASEFTAHQDYMGIALYFQRRSLYRWSRLFHSQAIEEAQHGTKIMNFLIDNEVAFDLPPLPGSTTSFASALAAAQASLGWEREVTSRFRAASQAALEEQDHTSHQFLQWFIAEQVEEEAKMQDVIDLLESGVNLFQAEPLLDQFDKA